MALYPCVDCGKILSPTATDCGGCDSTDPFGVKRADDKLRMQITFAGIIFLGLVFAAFHFDILTFEMVKNFLNHQAH